MISRWVKEAWAARRTREPSNSRMLDLTCLAMNRETSSGSRTPCACAFLRRIAALVSRSGGWMSAMRPHSKRERRRSSSVGISRGTRSELMTICLEESYKSLNVWKNSSCVRSLPAMNWMSSIRSRSRLRYRLRNSTVASNRMALMRSLVNFSDDT